MNTHTDLLNLIARQIKAESYLEIGVYNPDHNFNKIDVALKISVDPDPKAGAIIRATSDDFFTLFPDSRFDLIFIDGLHHADQVKKDLVNSFRQLNPGGVIVMHDCNPPTEATTCVPRGSQREWCGDTYKTASQISSPKFTVDFDYGCTVIIKDKEGPGAVLEFDKDIPSWVIFDKYRTEALSLVSVEEAKEIIAVW